MYSRPPFSSEQTLVVELRQQCNAAAHPVVLRLVRPQEDSRYVVGAVARRAERARTLARLVEGARVDA